MSRRRTAEPYVQQKVSIPATLMARFNLLYWDRTLNKPQYGKISEVISRLLADHVNEMEGNGPKGDTPHG